MGRNGSSNPSPRCGQRADSRSGLLCDWPLGQRRSDGSGRHSWTDSRCRPVDRGRRSALCSVPQRPHGLRLCAAGVSGLAHDLRERATAPRPEVPRDRRKSHDDEEGVQVRLRRGSTADRTSRSGKGRGRNPSLCQGRGVPGPS